MQRNVYSSQSTVIFFTSGGHRFYSLFFGFFKSKQHRRLTSNCFARELEHQISSPRTLDPGLFGVKPGSHMPPTYLGGDRRHGLGQRCGICEQWRRPLSIPGIDRRLACEVELSSTSQASRWSMHGTDYVSAINFHICRSCPRSYRQLCPELVGDI